MGMTKRIFYPESPKKLTKGEREAEKQEMARLWNIFCEKGRVCINARNDSDHDSDLFSEMREKLKEDPNAKFGPGFTYSGPLSLKELRAQLIEEGKSNEK